jgi:hypothetical protein
MLVAGRHEKLCLPSAAREGRHKVNKLIKLAFEAQVIVD